MRNIEIKCRTSDLASVARLALEAGAKYVAELHQVDTFFQTTAGRLKVRRTPDGRGELIAYHRPDKFEPHASDYDIYSTPDADTLTRVLGEVLAEQGVVKKHRTLYLLDNTRIHLDRVQGLGEFVELETLVNGRPNADAAAETHRIMAMLGLRETDLVAGAYADLLREPMTV